MLSTADVQRNLYLQMHPEVREVVDREYLKRYEKAKCETEAIRRCEGDKALIFLREAKKVYWFDHFQRYGDMGYGSLNEWADGEGFNPSTVHYGVQATNILYYFFDVPEALLKQVGEHKFGVILPMCNQLMKDALKFRARSVKSRNGKFERCRLAAIRWVEEAIDKGTTELNEMKGVVKGWERVSPRKKWTRYELLHTPELNALGQIVKDSDDNPVMRLRTAEEVLAAIGLYPTIGDQEVVRINAYAPPLKKETVTSMMLGDDPEDDDQTEGDDGFEIMPTLTPAEFERLYQGDWVRND